MRLLLKQYLASLRERDELEVILPDILTEAGFTVVSRPRRGTSQYGVDAVAIGPDSNTGAQSIFLLSIKSGDLNRATWDEGPQSLRPSLVDILDVYIPTHVPPRFKALPIVIALCFGGDIREDVRLRVAQFTEKHERPGRISFEEWSGDRIVDMIDTGLLRENIFPKDLQGTFRKAVALVDEPAVCVGHFRTLVKKLVATPCRKGTDRVRVARQIYIAMWTIYAWCRDAGNLEAAYEVAAIATLSLWAFCIPHVAKTKDGKAIAEVVEKSIFLNHAIGSEFIETHVAPYSGVLDGLGSAVPSPASVDITLKLFETLGRVALNGLWLVNSRRAAYAAGFDTRPLDEAIGKNRDIITGLISNNLALNTPLRDDHAIEIMTAALLLSSTGDGEFLAQWLREIVSASIFSHVTGGHFPCLFTDYADLARHPIAEEGYRERATAGSILYPTLAMWLAALDEDAALNDLAHFRTRSMAHSTWQFWFPDDHSEAHIYRDTDIHGSAFSRIVTNNGTAALIESVSAEVQVATDFTKLSAVLRGQWPMVLTACRLHRMPVPPHFWFMNLAAFPKPEESAAAV